MSTEDRAAFEEKLVAAEVDFMEAEARALAGEPELDTAPGVPYDQLTPEQRRARMEAARPAGWGSDERNANLNMVTARILSQGPR